MTDQSQDLSALEGLTTVVCAHCASENHVRIPDPLPEDLGGLYFECNACGKVTILRRPEPPVTGTTPPGIVAVTSTDRIGAADAAGG